MLPPQAPEACASANSATPASSIKFVLCRTQVILYMISIQMSRKKLKKFQILKEMEEKPVSVYHSREKEKEMRKKVEK